MATQSPRTDAQSPEVSRRLERANKILDAATALILRWGYNKTTIDDIARQAAVAKGTIYLHWKTREDLFKALIYRENVVWLEDFARRIADDTTGSTLRGVMKHSALALMKRPLLKALLLRDMEVIGKLAHNEQSSAIAVEKIAGFNTYLTFLREHGLVRTDLNLRQQVYMLSAMFLGYFLVKPLMPEELNVSDEELADLMAETVHRTLESGRMISLEEEQSVIQAFKQYLDLYNEVAQQQLRQELEK